MLDAAKALFIENGYSRTNMEQIAEHAGFGVATLYNYFKTKEGVFATMAREDMAILKQRGEDVLLQQTSDPIASVYELLQVYHRIFEFISYGLLHEFQDQAKNSGPLHEVSAWVIGWQHSQVARSLRFCQGQGTLSERLDCELAAEIVIDQLVRHSQRHRRISTAPPDSSHLRSVLELILAGWHCSGPSREE